MELPASARRDLRKLEDGPLQATEELLQDLAEDRVIVTRIRGPFNVSRRLKRGAIMPDGREERVEREIRIEQEKRENRDDRFDRDTIEEWEPERVDS
jgi:hypothetical protein